MKRVIALLTALVAGLPLAAQVKVTAKDDRVVIDVDGKPFTELIVKGEGVTKPYYYPIHASSGTVVTRHYPMKDVEGESKDHPHHRGLWFTHGDVNGLDFWTADPSRDGDKYGFVVLRNVSGAKSGKSEGSVKTVFDWKDGKGETILTEERVTTVYSTGLALRIMDVDITLPGVKKAHFGDTKEGTFAIRLADAMNERNGGTLLNAHGETGEKNVWGKASPWMDYYGEIAGEPLGVAIFDHPGNPKHPTYWHVRAYGLFAANIFGEHDFFRDESRDGSLTLEPKGSWRFRYRVMIHPGTPESANIDKHYANWAGGKYMAIFRKHGKCVWNQQQ